MNRYESMESDVILLNRETSVYEEEVEEEGFRDEVDDEASFILTTTPLTPLPSPPPALFRKTSEQSPLAIMTDSSEFHTPMRQRLDTGETEETARVRNHLQTPPPTLFPATDPETPISRTLQYSYDENDDDEYLFHPAMDHDDDIDDDSAYIDEDDHDEDDALSIVSSLSNDDSLQQHGSRHPQTNLPLPPITETNSAPAPPTEVSIPTSNEKRRSLSEDDHPQHSNRRMESLVKQLQQKKNSPPRACIPRPTMGRHKSAPAYGHAMAFPANACMSPLPPPDAIIMNGTVIHRRQEHDCASTTASPAIVGARRRRIHHRRGPSDGSITLGGGSITGQGSLKSVAPTMCSSSCNNSYTASIADNTNTSSCGGTTTETSILPASLYKRTMKSKAIAEKLLISYTGADEGLACCESYQTRKNKSDNVVKRELKYVVNKLTSPIRNIPMLKPKIDLHRSKGTLT